MNVQNLPEDTTLDITTYWPQGQPREGYVMRGYERVGYRCWNDSGTLVMAYAMRDGQMHGPFCTWHDNGSLCEEATYVMGKEHGTTTQYDPDGSLVGSYTLDHGTGIDRWFSSAGVLSEERHLRDGQRHGPERWWCENGREVWQEAFFADGLHHGIAREWNEHGRLRRGFPQYYVAGKRVTKRQYLAACRRDPSLPPFDARDNQPQRIVSTDDGR